MTVPTQFQTALPTDQHGPPEATPPSHRPGWWPVIRPLVLRLHFYAGVLVAPFILAASVTGLLYTIAPQVEQIAYHELTHVTPSGETVPLADQVAAARATHPDGAVIRVDVPEAADRSTRVVFTDETVPADHDMSVFVNPYTGQVQGQVRSYGQWLGFRAWLDELHRNLHLGAFGRHYSELAASWLWVVALGGLMLWLGRWRRDRRVRRLVLPDPETTGRSRAMSWHAVIGVWLLLGVLALSVSGLTWSRFAGANIGEVRTALSWTEPTPATSLHGDGTAAEHAHHGASVAATGDPDAVFSEGAGIDGVLDTARDAGLGDPLYLVPPADPGSAWTAAENKRDWPTRYDAISVDPATGEQLDRVDFADWPPMAKLTDWVIGAHMGILFGVLNQLALAALALGLIAATLLGYRMWWLRRPRGAGGLRFGRPAPRGAWRRLPWPAMVAAVTVVAVVGWFVPMLGVTLIGFLVVDAVIGAVRSRT
ncbi:PepSY domain-containing protein [Nocardioides sp. NBC_00368]|uniref:PepSY-associated TM helix domain-containing protein n=1 Tax=Nocardioides sp. NBC_00368 TaxID=2976000 RepID=UPI002E20B4BA